LILASASVSGQETDTRESDRGVALVEQFLENVTTLSASFEQELWSQNQTLIEISSGTVAIERPNRFRWEYIDPIEQLILADGELLRIYEPDIAQLTVSQLADMPDSSPAMLLSGTGDVSGSFDIEDATDARGLVWVTLRPRESSPDFRLFRLAFLDDSLVQMEIVDGLDQTTSIEFSDLRINQELDAELFELTVPEGTDILDGTG
jgi:outer membrane lipoprotein carrier protein